MSQKQAILAELQAGRRLTPLSALIRVHTLALSQRCGELRRDGWPIQSRLVKVGEKHVSEYWLEPCDKLMNDKERAEFVEGITRHMR